MSTGYCQVHGSFMPNAVGLCPGCGAAGPQHECPLQPVPDDEAILAFVGVLAKTNSASHVVGRLDVLGFQLGRKRR